MPSHLSGLAGSSPIQIPLNVSASTTSGIIGYEQNPDINAGGPTEQSVIVTRATLLITQQATAACTLNIGTASDAVTASDNLIDGISVHGAPANTVYDNFTDGGSDGTTRQFLNPSDYVTVDVASGDANGLQGTLYVDYLLIPQSPL